MSREALLAYLNERLSILKQWKLKHLLRDARNKNIGKIEEIEDIIRRIETENYKKDQLK